MQNLGFFSSPFCSLLQAEVTAAMVQAARMRPKRGPSRHGLGPSCQSRVFFVWSYSLAYVYGVVPVAGRIVTALFVLGFKRSSLGRFRRTPGSGSTLAMSLEEKEWVLRLQRKRLLTIILCCPATRCNAVCQVHYNRSYSNSTQCNVTQIHM